MATITATEDFTKWLRKLRDARAKAIIVERVQRVAGGLLGDVQPAVGQISELRVHYGPGYRVYFTRRGEELVVLLCGGDKSTQTKDIQKAKDLAAGL